MRTAGAELAPVARAAIVGVAAMIAGSLWLPWVTLGGGTRTSFGAFRSAQRLGLDGLAPLRVAWFLLPVLALAVAGAAVVGYRRVAPAGLALLAALVGAPVGLVLAAGSAAWGAGVSVVLAVVGLGLSVQLLRLVPDTKRNT